MNNQHSEGEIIEAKHDYASLIAIFLCQARNHNEVQFILNLLNQDIREFSDRMIRSIKERISCEPGISADYKSLAVDMIDGQSALRELAVAA